MYSEGRMTAAVPHEYNSLFFYTVNESRLYVVYISFE
jgi:hypothetical protein